MKFTKLQLLSLLTVLFLNQAKGQANYDENKVPDYSLPKLLVTQNGEKINDPESWMKIRRPEVLSLFEENMYGKIPGELKISSLKILEESNQALGGKAIRKQLLLTFENNGKKLDVNLLIYLPKTKKKVPLFVGYNFFGNHTVIDDPAIIVPGVWSRNSEKLKVTGNKPTEKSRGLNASRWAVDKIIDAGYGLATMFYCEVDPDKFGEYGVDFSDGVHPLLYKSGQTKPLANEWGAISAWAWGLSRAMDYFEIDDAIDQNKIIVMGHSRLAKTSLWVGALDQRFAIVISNESGCGGAALSRRKYGERLGGMRQYFAHWLCGNCAKYDDHEENLPVDQHMLIALIAPRPVYIASAEGDQWSDPKGEYLSGYFATPVYELFGKPGLSTDKMPEINHPVMTNIGYHIRSGVHDVTEYDWEQYIKFADKHLRK